MWLTYIIGGTPGYIAPYTHVNVSGFSLPSRVLLEAGRPAASFVSSEDSEGRAPWRRFSFSGQTCRRFNPKMSVPSVNLVSSHCARGGTAVMSILRAPGLRVQLLAGALAGLRLPSAFFWVEAESSENVFLSMNPRVTDPLRRVSAWSHGQDSPAAPSSQRCGRSQVVRLAGNTLARGVGGLRDGLCPLLPSVCPAFFTSSAPHFFALWPRFGRDILPLLDGLKGISSLHCFPVIWGRASLPPLVKVRLPLALGCAN